MLARDQNFTPLPLNVVGSSIFGRYPKISIEKTYNMFQSDEFMVPYGGYQIAIPASRFNEGLIGRGIHTSIKMGKLIIVIDSNVYLANFFFNQNASMNFDFQVIRIGQLQTSSGIVYIAENNKPQVAISDGTSIYIYDPTLSPAFQTITTSFIPGFIDFHDTYFLCAASGDTFYSPSANNTWRLSAQNDGTSWPNAAANIGLLQTKPDNTQAVVRFPSKGNMIYVFGSTVTEPWFDVGYQLFPYQRINQFNIDYGCISPATVAATDQVVVWLAKNEKAGPIIVYSDGGLPKPITTDGIDYMFAQLTNPADSQAFIYRQDGHLFYHINFYTDNLSLFYDFNTGKIYHASDENMNYFIASSVAFFNQQYYFVSKNNGNLYAFDNIFTTYDGAEIPRIRTCKPIRKPQQEYFIANDAGFTIETGETPYQQQDLGEIYLMTENGNYLITEGNRIFLMTENGDYLTTENGNFLVTEQLNPTDFSFLVAEQHAYAYVTPRVDMSISIDGGASFSSDFSYVLPAPGQRKNRLYWWQLGMMNDLTLQFKFWGMGRFVVTDGVVNTRQ